MPLSASLSTNEGCVPPHGPDEPSTWTQSEGDPLTDANMPVGSTIATDPAANPTPLSGRAPRSAMSPTTEDSGIEVLPVSPAVEPPDVAPADAEVTRTSRTRSGC